MATIDQDYPNMNLACDGYISISMELKKPKTTMNREPSFYVGEIPVFSDVMLAPMAGFSDVPHRALCRSFGSSMSYSEFVSAEDIVNGSERAEGLLRFTNEDSPMVFQIFGNDPGMILAAAKKAEVLGPSIIDINMGCSTRRVSGRGAGVGMMRQPAKVAETFSLLTEQLNCPVTAKIRLGWERERNYLEIAHILEDNGAALIAIHPRTKEQQYKGQALWSAIAEVKNLVNVPVIGNGDISKPDDINRMKVETGCDAVMIGRGAIGNPWLFSRVERDELLWSKYTQVVKSHLELMRDFYGDRGLILFRKYVKRYLDGLEALDRYSRRLVTTASYEEFFEILAETVIRFGSKETGRLRLSE